MKNIFISGISGNMGRRYAIILHDLGIKVYGADERLSFTQQAMVCAEHKCDGIIIASPTNTHLDAINIFHNFWSRPILVEKPLGRCVPGIDRSFNIRMVNQYEYLIDKDRVGSTYYNYYKTGSDGVYWDCINIIGLANGPVKLETSSARWRCIINGQELSIADMDGAYYSMIENWLTDPKPNHEYQVKAHSKVVDLIKREKKENNKSKFSFASKVIPILGSKDS